jgi:hypothetical protein
MADPEDQSLQILRLIAEHLKRIKYPTLTRPKVRPDEPPTIELVSWGIQAYSLPWIRHFGTLISGILTLSDADNRASVRIVGRSSFELCAHVYYVKKHLKQFLDRGDLDTAWKFLMPIATGSRYVSELDSQMNREFGHLFPTAAHISKAVNCFKEVMPEGSEDDYSYLSEYCHPNMMAFKQHYQWTTPETMEMIPVVVFGAYGAIAGSAIQGIATVYELLGIGKESKVRKVIHQVMLDFVKEGRKLSDKG